MGCHGRRWAWGWETEAGVHLTSGGWCGVVGMGVVEGEREGGRERRERERGFLFFVLHLAPTILTRWPCTAVGLPIRIFGWCAFLFGDGRY